MSRNLPIIKKELFNLKEKLSRYIDAIPEGQKRRFEKDMGLIFRNLEAQENSAELGKMEKLAKTKLRSVERIYGVVRSESSEEVNKKEIFSKEEEEFLINTFNLKKNDVDPSIPKKMRYREFLSSPKFNPNVVNRYQEEFYERNKIIAQKYEDEQVASQEEKKKRKEQLVKEVQGQDQNMDMNKVRDKDGKVDVTKFEEAIREIMILNNYPNPDEMIKNIDIESLAQQYESGEMSITQDEQQEEARKKNEKAKQVDSSKTEEMFRPFMDENLEEFARERPELRNKIDEIFSKKNLTMHQKAFMVNKEIKIYEQERKEKNCSGDVSVDITGEVKFTFFKDKDQVAKEKDDLSESEEQTYDGVKRYVWRNGKLVEGSGDERKKVTYSNWHGSNLNPDDLRKHRELLDRQHFGGPLWEGIKYRGVMDDPTKFIMTPEKKDLVMKAKQMNIKPDKNAKVEYIEVVR